MPFRIRFVEDAELPKTVAWAVARDDQGRMVFVKKSHLTADLLAEAIGAAQFRCGRDDCAQEDLSDVTIHVDMSTLIV